MTDDVWALIETERHALAAFLDSLDRVELMTRSLCSEWTVQEVCAHLAWASTTSLGTLMSAMAIDLFRANRTNARLAQEWASRGPDAIVARLRDVDGCRHLTPGTRPGRFSRTTSPTTSTSVSRSPRSGRLRRRRPAAR